MPAALARAIEALRTHPQCAELFGTAATRSSGFNPIDVIQQVYKQGGGTVAGQSVNTTFAWMLYGNAKTVGLNVTIANNASRQWNAAGEFSDTYPQAELLLHELGHIYDNLQRYGSGGSQIQSDGALGSQSGKNDDLIVTNCFK